MMAFAVPAGIDVGIAQPIVGAQIDDAHAPLQEGRDRFHAGAVRQTAKGTLDTLGDQTIDLEWLTAQVDPAGKARMHVRDQRRVFLTGSDGHDLCPWMAQKNIDQLKTGVTRAAQDRDFRHDRSVKVLCSQTIQLIVH